MPANCFLFCFPFVGSLYPCNLLYPLRASSIIPIPSQQFEFISCPATSLMDKLVSVCAFPTHPSLDSTRTICASKQSYRHIAQTRRGSTPGLWCSELCGQESPLVRSIRQPA
ncbi:hypothetical protein BDZ89DRAFT_310047 [Hymenopellis radicata]|nr:hypothetical protein BDZ89DRAFT_310047 [Hymenopellis radicata]